MSLGERQREILLRKKSQGENPLLVQNPFKGPPRIEPFKGHNPEPRQPQAPKEALKESPWVITTPKKG